MQDYLGMTSKFHTSQLKTYCFKFFTRNIHGNIFCARDITTLKKGIGEKLSLIILYVSLSTSGLIVALVFAWKVSLVALAMTPVVMISAALLYKVRRILFIFDSYIYLLLAFPVNFTKIFLSLTLLYDN